MKREGTILTGFALLIVLACFLYPSLLYKSIWGSSTPDSQWVRLERNDTLLRHQLQSPSEPPLNCVMPSIADFPDDFMTQDQRLKQGGVVVHFLLAIYMFIALAIVCDGYFIPSLERMTKKLHMDRDIGYTTLLACGSSAPELFTSVVGAFITESDIGVATIVGSAVFNMVLVVGVCGLFSRSALSLTPWPLLRDCVCYLLGIVALIVVTYDHFIYWYEAAALVTFFLIYLVILNFNRSLECCFKRLTGVNKENPDIENNKDCDERKALLKGINQEDKERLNRSDPGEEVKINDHSDDSPFSIPQGFVSRVLWIFALPISCLFYVTIPDCRSDKWEKWYLVSFILSVAWIASLTYVLVWMVVIMGFTLGIPEVIMGLTFLAAGNSVADGISSLIVARQGQGDMAVANAVRSNLFDILLCLGLPWLLKTTAVDFGSYIFIETGSTAFTCFFLIGTVFAVMFLLMVNKWYLNKCIGVAFVIIYLAIITVATLLGLNLFWDINLPTCEVI